MPFERAHMLRGRCCTAFWRSTMVKGSTSPNPVVFIFRTKVSRLGDSKLLSDAEIFYKNWKFVRTGVLTFFWKQTWIRAQAWWIKRSKSFRFPKTCWNWPFLCSQGRFVVVAAASPSSQPSFQDTFLPDMLPLDGFGLRVTWRVASFVPLVDTRLSSDSSELGRSDMNTVRVENKKNNNQHR